MAADRSAEPEREGVHEPGWWRWHPGRSSAYILQAPRPLTGLGDDARRKRGAAIESPPSRTGRGVRG
jgi:hypothetical protein